jgi:hypothetical protein
MRALLALGVVTLATVANACPVCGVGPEKGQGTYIFMSGILSALPLLSIGGVVLWVALRVRAAAKADEAALAARVTQYGGAGPRR